MSFIEEARLRAILRQTQQDLRLAEAELAARMAEIREFDAKIESRLGALETELEILEMEIQQYRSQIRQLQQARAFPESEPYHSANSRAHPDQQVFRSSAPPSPDSELRTLYRNLARRYHPDTAFDDLDRNYRTEMMMRINEAYANRDLNELRKHAQGMVSIPIQPETPKTPHYRSTLARIETETIEYQNRLRETRAKIEKLRFHPSVQLSLKIKLGWREGRDVIGKMANDLKERIVEKTKIRDELLLELNEIWI